MQAHKHIHFMGIGGIGMSALAFILKKRGFTVSGCDIDISGPNCTTLKNLGCTLYQGHNNPHCHDSSITTLVYTTMIPHTHPEIVAAQAKGISCLHRSQMLALLTPQDWTIAVAGSHGKTTTSALVSHLFINALQDPCVVIGGNLSTINGNAFYGQGKHFIIEADESDRSFLNLHAPYQIVTNISFEHVETYKDLNDIQETFFRFMSKVPSNGLLVACYDNINLRSTLEKLTCPTQTYGFDTEVDWHIYDIHLEAHNSTFSLRYKDNFYKNITTALAGKHNILNSTAAFIMGHHHGLSEQDLRHGLITFPGVDRRFTFKGTTKKGAQIFDDYGHHPYEISSTFEIALNKPHNKLILVFQPHRYSRMAGLWNEFIKVLAYLPVDKLIITDIHSAHENPLEGITSKRLVECIQKVNPSCPVTYVTLNSNFESLKNTILSLSDNNDLILLQGAGKITNLSSYLIDQ